jgi:hypothetical protein
MMPLNNLKAGACTICGGKEFSIQPVLWPGLIQEWELGEHEVDYINRQQGHACLGCGSSMRVRVLALAILSGLGDDDTFDDFIQSSASQQLKIFEINEAGNLHVEKMGRGYAWLDTGTHGSLLEAGLFVSTMEHRQGLKMACPEEITWRNGWIDDRQLRSLATPLAKSEYGIYLSALLEEGRERN